MYSSIRDTDRPPASRGNNTILDEAQAEYEESLANTLAAIAEADSINDALRNGTITEEQARERAAENPMLEVETHPANVQSTGNQGTGTASQGPSPGATPVTATGGRGNTVIITYSDGTKETRSGGTRSWRNNNPGNIRSPASLKGIIGSAGRFFPYSLVKLTDRLPLLNCWENHFTKRRHLAGRLPMWAPPSENNTAAYQHWVQNTTGINGQTPMSALNQPQLQTVANAIRKVEAWRPGKVIFRSPQTNDYAQGTANTSIRRHISASV